MKRSAKAALLSALIFPGIGHMVLKQHRRGSILILMALAAFSVIVTRVIQRALTIVDRINKGEILDASATIVDMASNSTTGADSLIGVTAVIVLMACWLVGIIDSYRLGIAQEE